MSSHGSKSVPTVSSEIARQWSDWEISRRGVFKVSLAGIAAAALANGGMLPLSTAVMAQDASATPVPGGSLSLSLADDDVQNFDPIVPTDNMSIWTMLLIYDQLIRVAADGVSLEPGLAEKWDISADQLTYTFHLRDAKFHDGTAVTADDVIYSINRAAKDPTSTWASMVTAIKGMTAPDPKTAVIVMSTIWTPFLADLALFACSIIPKAAHEAQKEKLFQKPIGSGPFVFDSWDKGSQLTLKKNPNFWEPGKPYLDEIVLKVLTDANARMLQFQGGDLDVVTAVPYSQIETLKTNPDVVVLQDSVAQTNYIAMNNTRAPWSDKNLRQAINYAVDKQSLIDNVLFGSGQAANTYLPLMAGHDDTIPGYPFDLAKAKELVARSAGKDGFKGELLISTGDPVSDQIGQIVAAQLKEIGGDIKVITLESAARREKVRIKSDYDMSIGYYTTDIIDPDELTAFAVQSDGGAKAIYTLYKNDQVDALCKEAEIEPDNTKRMAMYSEIQKLHSEDAPMIFLFYPTGGVATTSSVKNFKVLPTGNYRLWETWKTS